MSFLLPTKVKYLHADIAANQTINNSTALEETKITPNRRLQMIIDKTESMLNYQPRKTTQ